MAKTEKVIDAEVKDGQVVEVKKPGFIKRHWKKIAVGGIATIVAAVGAIALSGGSDEDDEEDEDDDLDETDDASEDEDIASETD